MSVAADVHPSSTFPTIWRLRHAGDASADALWILSFMVNDYTPVSAHPSLVPPVLRPPSCFYVRSTLFPISTAQADVHLAGEWRTVDIPLSQGRPHRRARDVRCPGTRRRSEALQTAGTSSYLCVQSVLLSVRLSVHPANQRISAPCVAVIV
ncbi:hypothetical protein OH76DRAFT_656206 [Lentinus brumalis]|uniref:Uncharacterized protein n=1 Tax=Lentinus brumalis TaxID=2498619 RepID=A0A371D7E7_9APHY|nr:hypothetical protein OH76DRAFT_656206 [Polyporus brumalis]